MKEFDIVLIGN